MFEREANSGEEDFVHLQPKIEHFFFLVCYPSVPRAPRWNFVTAKRRPQQVGSEAHAVVSKPAVPLLTP